MNAPPTFSGAVLAGGRSTRMGTDKAFLRVGDETLLERQLRLLREVGAAELLLSGRAGVDYAAFAARVVPDKYPSAGPLAGLAAVLGAASSELVLVLAVDLPAMTSAMLDKILRACQNGVGRVPIDAGGFQPLASVYPKAALPLAERHLHAADRSMHSFVQAAAAQGFVLPLPMQPAEAVCFTNWNLPSDWKNVSP